MLGLRDGLPALFNIIAICNDNFFQQKLAVAIGSLSSVVIRYIINFAT